MISVTVESVPGFTASGPEVLQRCEGLQTEMPRLQETKDGGRQAELFSGIGTGLGCQLSI